MRLRCSAFSSLRESFRQRFHDCSWSWSNTLILKANQNFRDLQNQLEGTENRINVARQRYNEAAEEFNSSIRSFPNSLTNSLLLHLKRKEYIKAEEGAKAVPKVKF